MKKYLIIILLLFLCFGCANTTVDDNPVDVTDEPTEVTDNPTDTEDEPTETVAEPPYSTLEEYADLDYFCPNFLLFDSSLFEDYNRVAIIMRTDKHSSGKLFSIAIYETSGSLYDGDYELVDSDLFNDNLYSFSGDFTDYFTHNFYKDGFTFPLENDEVDGYFVLSDDFKTLYFLTDEEQLATGDYSNAIECTILYYE